MTFFWVGNFLWTRWGVPSLVGTFEVSYAMQNELLGRWTFVYVKFKPRRSCWVGLATWPHLYLSVTNTSDY